MDGTGNHVPPFGLASDCGKKALKAVDFPGTRQGQTGDGMLPVVLAPEINPELSADFREIGNLQRLLSVAVHKEEVAIQIQNGDTVVTALHNPADKGIAFSLAALRLYPCGDVNNTANDTDGLSLFIA